MAIKNSKTNTPKEQDGKTGQQMAGGYTLYGRPDGPPIKKDKSRDPKFLIPPMTVKPKTKKLT